MQYICVVRANAKIHILKQFTTSTSMLNGAFQLYVLMQRYTFWSNSQLQVLMNALFMVVRANAKIHILKQFTTYASTVTSSGKLYVLMQRYTFWSNSQQVKVVLSLIKVVRANAKIHILKQFTTLGVMQWHLHQLYVLMQRYTFWSNSQHIQLSSVIARGCTC